MESAIILGAGFSYVAGLPLTRQLFEGSTLPQSVSQSSAQSDKEVLASYNAWAASKSAPNAEAWMAELYQERNNPLQPMLQGTTWDDAVRFALRRLVKLPKGKNAPYYYGISTFQSHPVHAGFWIKCKEELGARYVVSMNYDILPEQALHMSKGISRSSPSCYYGGFQHTQVVRKMTNVTRGEYELLELGHEVVLYKLHGSLNWAWERHSPTMKIHDDVRAVFRYWRFCGFPGNHSSYTGEGNANGVLSDLARGRKQLAEM